MSFYVPTGSDIVINVGTNGSGAPAQTAGTVFTYGWQICFENQTTNVLGNLSIDDTITTNNLVVNGSTTGLNKSSVGLGLADNTSDLNKPVSTAQAAAISTAVANLVSTAPATLDTLKERAAALNNDANFQQL